MELTPTQAEELLTKRMQEHPEMAKVFNVPTFRKVLSEILDFTEISEELLPRIEQEVRIVLCFYAPISQLPENITKTTGIPLDKSKKIATLIETLLLSEVQDTLLSFDIAWYAQLEKEKKGPEYVRYAIQKGDTESLKSVPEEQFVSHASEIPTAILAKILREGILSLVDQKELRKEIETRGTDVEKDWLRYTPTGSIFGK